MLSQGVYDDDWINQGETMEEYKNEDHSADVHKNVPPTMEVETPKIRRRSTEEYAESYDDDWLLSKRLDSADNNANLLEKREESGWVYDVRNGGSFDFDKTVEPGDYIELYGIYNFVGTWSVNIKSDQQILLHMAFRGNNLVLNSYQWGWKTEIRPEYPDFKSGKEFKLSIVMMDDNFHMSVNDVPLTKSFPYRIAIGSANKLQVNANMVWNKIKLPNSAKSYIYTEKYVISDEIQRLGDFIRENVQGKPLEELKSFVTSEEGALAVYTLKLYKAFKARQQIFDPKKDATIQNKIIEDKEILELLMTSGDVQGNKYKEAIEILAELFRQDSRLKENPLKLRLAIATAITHSSTVKSQAIPRKTIDGIEMYQTFIDWSQQNGTLLSPFFDVSAWHLRYVIGTWQEKEELIWAQQNTPEDYKNDKKIADVTHKMMAYKLENDDGVSVQNGVPYYYYYPSSLQAFLGVGGVCGVVSRYAVGFAQAYGVPAMLVGQPGHCAYIWYKNGKFVLGNDVYGWGNSHTHYGIQHTWQKPAIYFQLMNDAQNNLESYRLSEKMRLASEFSDPKDRFLVLEDASSVCPQNYDVWNDMKAAIEEPTLSKSEVQSTLLPSLVNGRRIKSILSDIATEKPILASECFGETAQSMNDESASHGYCQQTTGEFEIDLQHPCTIDELRVWWWGRSSANNFNIFAMSQDGNYHLVATQSNSTTDGSFNHWTFITGWNVTTYKIKVELKDGQLDYWGYGAYFGIRTFSAMGWERDESTEVSHNKSVIANSESSDVVSLVDGDHSTIWYGNKNPSWFEIDLGQICILNEIDLQWVNSTMGKVPDDIKVSLSVAGGNATDVENYSPLQNVLLDPETYGTHVRVEFHNGGDMANSTGEGMANLYGVNLNGIAFTAKEIIKTKIHNDLHKNHPFVQEDLKEMVDGWKCEF